MDKQAALQHFKEHHFTPLLDIQLDMLEAMFHRYQAQLIFDFKESFRDLCIHILSMQQQGQKIPLDISTTRFCVLRCWSKPTCIWSRLILLNGTKMIPIAN